MTGKHPPLLAGHRVLVVEDEELISMMLVDVLEEFGATVMGPASTVADALQLLEHGGTTLALLDLSLKGESAYPVADHLVRSGVPFAFLTGYGQGQLEARYAGTPLVTKPFGSAQLAETLMRLVGASSRCP